MLKGVEELSEEEKKALRGSKFAPLPSRPSSSRPNPRIPHPGGPVTTNKAVALAKFLERKLQEPGGLDSLNPDLVESAVRKAKETDTSEEESLKRETKRLKKEKKKKQKKKKKNKKLKIEMHSNV
ncbi:hypothetical protein V2J09_013735 [Rumex salicifolius]